MLVLNSANQGSNIYYPSFKGNFEGGAIGEFNANGPTNDPSVPGSCSTTVVTAGGSHPAARANGTKLWRAEMTTTCQNSGDPTAASRNIWFHVHPVMNFISGVWTPATTNPNWYPADIIYPGEESGYYSAWYWLHADTRCTSYAPGDPDLLTAHTFNSPGMIMEIKDRHDYDGTANDNAQWQCSLKSKAEIESYFGITVPLTPSRADAPLLHVFQPFITGQVPVVIEPPRGQWFKMTWEIERHVFLKVYIDGVLIDTKPHTHSLYANQFGSNQMFVGIRTYTGTGGTGTGTTKPIAWSPAVNRYGMGVGHMYCDDVTYQPLKRTKPIIPFDSGV